MIIEKVEGSDTVKIGSTIEVDKDGEVKRFTIVGSNEAKPESGFISNESPLGKAFIGKKSGAVVRVKIPKGEVTYKIVKIE